MSIIVVAVKTKRFFIWSFLVRGDFCLDFYLLMGDSFVFHFIPSSQKFDIGKDLLPRLAGAKEAFYGVNIAFQWLDIGTTPDYFKIISMAIEGKVNGVKPHDCF